MKSNRRHFLKYAGLGAAATIYSPFSYPSVLMEQGPLYLHRNESMENSLKSDVLVVGAGSSGVPAAIAAARSGARVVLIEEDMVPGGAPVDNYVAMLCGGPRAGIFKEMVDILDRDHDMTNDPPDKRWHERWFMPSAWLRVVSMKLRAEKNITFLGGSPVIRVLLSEGGNRNIIRGVSVPGRDGKIQDIEAKIVIDATGTGIVATMSGCDYLYGTESRNTFNEPVGPDMSSNDVQLCTLMLVSQRLLPDAEIDLERVTNPRDPGGGLIGREPMEEIRKRNTGTYLHWAGTVRCSDTRDPVEVTRAHSRAMEKIGKDVTYLYQNGYVAHIAPKLGIREVRRIVGDKILTVNDLIQSAWPEDVIATGNYGLDSWGASYLKGVEINLPEKGYGLPYRMLITKGMDNLFVVGKCVSASHLGMSAIRVQPIVSQMGQAAGTAAGMCIMNQTGIRSLEIASLQQKLRQAGMLQES